MATNRDSQDVVWLREVSSNLAQVDQCRRESGDGPEIRSNDEEVQDSQDSRVEEASKPATGSSSPKCGHVVVPTPPHAAAKSKGKLNRSSGSEWEQFLNASLGSESSFKQRRIVSGFMDVLKQHGISCVQHFETRNPLRKVLKMPRKTRQCLWLSESAKYLFLGPRIVHDNSELDLSKVFRIRVSSIKAVLKGRKTNVFNKTGKECHHHRYLSLVCSNRTGRSEQAVNWTIDLEFEDLKQREAAFLRLTLVIITLQKNRKWFQELASHLVPNPPPSVMTRASHTTVATA